MQDNPKALDSTNYGTINTHQSSYIRNNLQPTTNNSFDLQKAFTELKKTCTGEGDRVQLSQKIVEEKVVELSHDDQTRRSLHIGRNYMIDAFTKQFGELPSDVHKQSREAHRDLAQGYKQTAEKIAGEKGLGIVSYYNNYGRNFFGNEDQEYHEALRIIHLAIASQFGCALSSWELAKIYQKGDYFLPLHDIPRKDDIAVEYAATSQKQGGEDALRLLGELYEKDSYFCYSPYAIRCKDLANGKTNISSDTNKGKHTGDQLDESDIAMNYLTHNAHRSDTF